PSLITRDSKAGLAPVVSWVFVRNTPMNRIDSNDRIDSFNEILNSWKQVAAYLGRGTRTVQRWEHELGLPVRRPRGKSRSAVIALRKDLDAWVRNRPQLAYPRNGNGDATLAILADGDPITKVPLTETIQAARGLRCQNRQLRREVSLALISLVASLKRIHGDS